MNKVSVSTLPMDFKHIDISLFQVSNADYIHLDVMDGEFVEEEAAGVKDLELLREKTDLVIDVHLMIEEPEKHVEDYIKAGGDIINFHFEAAKDPKKVIELIKKNGARAGLSINPETGVEDIKDLVPLVDQILVMSVHPGKGGQEFIEDVLEKVKELRELREDLDIEVDGGVNEKTGEKAALAGANILCSGSYIFGFDDPKIGVDILRNV